jgi:hypothetical protein
MISHVNEQSSAYSGSSNGVPTDGSIAWRRARDWDGDGTSNTTRNSKYKTEIPKIIFHTIGCGRINGPDGNAKSPTARNIDTTYGMHAFKASSKVSNGPDLFAAYHIRIETIDNTHTE